MTTTIPGVRDQVRTWTSGRSKDAAAPPQRETLDAGNLTILGTVGRSSFARTRDNRELRLRGPVMAHGIEEAAPDAILVTRQTRASDGRPRVDVFLATVQEPGTFERLQARKVYRGPKERRPGPLDGLAELRRPADRQFVRLAPDDDSPKGIIKGALSKRPMSLWTDSAPTPMTVARLIEMANAEGGNIRHHNGHTLADWTKIRRHRALLVAAWRLVDASMADKPEPCAYEHKGEVPLADTLDPAGVPVCNRHVGWEPDAA